MDIHEFAMQMELDGKKYYQDLMNSAEDKGLKRIFEMLAHDEEEHHKIINEMRNIEERSIRSETLKNANNIFAKMLCSDEKFNLTTGAIEAYKHAISLEDKSIELYEQQYSKTENEEEKKVFRKLVDEEKKHKLVIENILNFVSEPERNRSVKTVDSDPEFARYNSL